MTRADEKKTQQEYVEVWEDLVSIKELVFSLLICSVTTLIGYFIAPNEPPRPLFYGLVGALIGFIAATILIRPKRIFRMIEDER